MTLNPPTLADLVDLQGRTSIVTGGAMGIGRGIVERLSEAGASVVIGDADLEAAETTAKELRRTRDFARERWPLRGRSGHRGRVILRFAHGRDR